MYGSSGKEEESRSVLFTPPQNVNVQNVQVGVLLIQTYCLFAVLVAVAVIVA